MKSFKTAQNNYWHNLSIDSFENATSKKYPYYQEIDGKIRHFAICPACSNPIQIINLYNSRFTDQEGKAAVLHARHYSNTVKDLATYSSENYDKCPLARPSAFGTSEKQIDPNKKNEIIELLEKYPDLILYFMQKYTGINFSENKFNKIKDRFIKEEGYYFVYVNKYNLPYSMLYLSGNQSIFMQHLNDEELINDLREKSVAHSLNDKNQIVRDNKEYVPIEMFYTNYRHGNKEQLPSMLMKIEEINKSRRREIIKKRIPINAEHFARAVSRKEGHEKPSVQHYIK